ncbi:hypothetical protein JRQ81_008938 [Phrynocephalus forsythii]|uniref:Peptidase S1 domain-containing protein n=1 Tax=Phrynocephalus forsythii TaxID=171643 RepID=A0A9Q0XBV6_9SAUR|nr:hypothetical protein JRQ81_008938 [Phrynocephalus forsythii]
MQGGKEAVGRTELGPRPPREKAAQNLPLGSAPKTFGNFLGVCVWDEHRLRDQEILRRPDEASTNLPVSIPWRGLRLYILWGFFKGFFSVSFWPEKGPRCHSASSGSPPPVHRSSSNLGKALQGTPFRWTCRNRLWLAAGASRSWVIGGREAAPHSRPFMASIQLNGEHFCGGFLVRKRWVMTAAHCLIPRRTPAIRVVLGAHSLQTPEGSQQIFGVLESVAHQGYDPKTVQNDIRLLKLNKSSVLNRDVRRIRLPPAGSDLAPGVMCQVIGWGDISNYGTVPTTLMEANVTVVERKACNALWSGHVYGCMICATNTGRHLRGFCSGDSGGPLVCGARVHGIVSFNGKRCGNPRRDLLVAARPGAHVHHDRPDGGHVGRVLRQRQHRYGLVEFLAPGQQDQLSEDSGPGDLPPVQRVLRRSGLWSRQGV